MKAHLQCAIEHHQILLLPRKMTLQNFRVNVKKQVKRHFHCGDDPRMIRPWSKHETVSPQPASQARLLFELTTSIFYWKIQHFAPPLTFKNSPRAAPATKSDTWTSPSAAPAMKSHTWTSPSAAPATKSDTWTSPSAAPATKKWHLNFTKCTCHEIWSHASSASHISFTMRGATSLTLQPHQILRLPRRKTRMLHPHHMCNVIYIARSNSCQDRTSPNTAPATKNDTA